MGKLNVFYLRGFLECEPTSTSIYVESLILGLQKCTDADVVGRIFTPKMLLPPWLQSNWGMRFAKFVLFPFQVLGQTDGIVHLLDHGYAHFLFFHNPDRTIVTVSDLMPILWWKKLLPVKTKKNIPITVLYSLSALKRAAHIIAVSENTKKDLVKLLGCDPAKITVVHHGIDEIFRPYDASYKSTLRNQWFGSDPKKIVLITGFPFYKNHETALKVIAYLLANGMKDVYLVKTENATQNWLDLIRKYGLEKNVINIGLIPRSQMPDLYNVVDVLLFPSIYEGFGWPPLEAMACGTPAVTSNVASLPEIMGDMNTMCDPFDVVAFSGKIQRLLEDEEYRQQTIQKGLTQSAKFTWDKAAHEVISVYERVAK